MCCWQTSIYKFTKGTLKSKHTLRKRDRDKEIETEAETERQTERKKNAVITECGDSHL
jgi:hypothetical protein